MEESTKLRDGSPVFSQSIGFMSSLFVVLRLFFFAKEKSYGEVLNDIDGDIVNFFRVMQNDDDRAILKRLLQLTPYSRAEYDLAHVVAEDPVEKARRMLIRSLMGFHSDSVNTQNSKSGFRNDCNRSFSLPVHNWYDYPDYMDDFAARLRHAVIEQTDAFNLFAKWEDRIDYLWYIDPPYPHHVRTRANKHQYTNEMTDEDHQRLVSVIMKLKGMVVLSGYHTDLYAPLVDAGWKVLKKQVGNSVFQSGSRTECLWINQNV